MRRAEFAVVPASSWHPARLPVLRSSRPLARTLALLGAAILATVVAVSMPGRPVRRAPVTWANGSTGLPVAAWAPVSRSLGADDPGLSGDAERQWFCRAQCEASFGGAVLTGWRERPLRPA